MTIDHNNPVWYITLMAKCKTKLQEAIDALSGPRLTKLAKELMTTEEYLTKGHLYYARRIPAKLMFSKLQYYLGLSDTDMINHFYRER